MTHCLRPPIGARARQLLGTLLLAYAATFTVSSNAQMPPTQALSTAQQKEASQLVSQVQTACLKGTPAPPNTNNLMVKRTLEWAREPAVCGCVATHLHARITPTLFNNSKEQMEQFWQDFAETDVVECSVPTVKARFAQSCEELLGDAFASMPAEQTQKRVAELGYRDLASMMRGSCTCIRNAIKDVTPQQWAASSLAAYHDYQERKRTGKPTVKGPESPLEKAMAVCITPH